MVQVADLAHVVASDNLWYMSELEPRSMKLIVTSPPYNMNKEYEDRSSLQAWLICQRHVIEASLKLLHPQGSLCWQVGNYIADDGEILPLDVALYPLFKELDPGLKLRNRIVWRFGHGLHCKKRFSGRHETILWFTKGDDYVFNLDAVRVPQKYPNKKHYKGPKKGELSCNPLGCNPADVWDIPNVKFNHPEKTDHPCQFPVELVERLVLSLTNPGDRVFDPYMGVGSTIIAAIKHGREGYGCDTVEAYVNTAKDRIALLNDGKLVLRPMGRPVYAPK